MELALRESEIRHRAILETALDGIIVMDDTGRIREFNPAAEQIFGHRRDEVLGRDLADVIIPPSWRERHRRGLAHYLATGEATILDTRVEVTALHASGSEFPAELAISRIQLDGPPVFTAYLRDIGARKRAEEEQQRLRDEIIRTQAATLAELSTPLIPISDDVLVMPLIGAVDSRRAQQVVQALLQGIAGSQVQFAILDITGVAVVDTEVANALIRAAQAVKLLGVQVILTGIRPEVAQTLVGLGADLSGIVTCSTLQSGIAHSRRPRASGVPSADHRV
jgi:rsbT co-antagonist protein RsbR